MKKNIICFVLAFVLILSLSACGNKDSDKNVQDSSTSAVSMSQEEAYNGLVKIVSEKKAMEAWNYHNKYYSLLKDYKDFNSYKLYIIGLMDLEKSCYGDAYDNFNQIRGFLDSDSIIAGIDSKVSIFDGVYKNKSVKYNQYVCFDHGRVTFIFEGDDMVSPCIYLKTLVDYTFTTGEKTLAIGYAFLNTPTEIDYIMATYEEDGSSFILGASEGSEYNTFSGYYEKTNMKAPPVQE